VYVGAEGSGTRAASKELFKAAFVKWFNAWEGPCANLDFEEASAGLKGGQFDAGIFDTGTLASATTSLLTGNSDFQLIQITGNVAAGLQEGGRRPVTITTPDGRTNVRTMGSGTVVVTHKDTQPAIARRFVAALERHRADIEPLLTWTTPRAASPLITDPDRLKAALHHVMDVHEGLWPSRWEFTRSLVFQLPAFAVLLLVQLATWWRAAGHVRVRVSSVPPRLDDPAATLTPPLAQVVSARVTALGNIMSALITALSNLFRWR